MVKRFSHYSRYTQRATTGLFLTSAIFTLGFGASADTAGPGEWQTLDEMGFSAPTEAQSKDQITVYGEGTPVVYGAENSIEELEDTEEEDGETIISLSTDILFAPDEWKLPSNAETKLEDILADVPDGAQVDVDGHTDSVKGEVDNQELSTKRAEAVADTIGDIRSDLELEVEGFADSEPKESESGSDVEDARKANRRVELRYEE